MPSTPGLPARRAALKLIDAVLRRGETLEQAEGAAMSGVHAAEDRALARAIATEVLRWLTDLDALIDSATKQNLPYDAKVRSVLRIMLAQALRLGTPPHAVVATGLPLLAGGPRRLAHGVFSTLAKREATLPVVPTLPDRVRARWGERADAIAPGLADPPEIDLALRDPSQTDARAAAMGGVSLAPGHVRLPRGTAVEALEGFAEGKWWVQDLAAQTPARLLGEGEGRHVLDLCAAPGGKTLALAAAGWKVTALDISKRRLDLLKANLRRTGLAASPLRADALTWEPKHRFDAILLDAPCTATGTCRRHPDVLHRIGRGQIAEMVELQRALITRAADWLAPGGRLVYAVCSLEEEEGEAQARWIGETLGLDPVPVAAAELPAGLAPTGEGHVRTHPGLLAEAGGLDGFFVSRWVRP
ncbi:RsmB/NOP family class I SAM-dependent RNA methyltransferase [Erythrobacter sp.]|jgi:16S rRNA (cytosine967-C5)-methyltransferase|uniref:RsmB/NOP family class I SAM-dependent RNA methyltransferase n=1 Tax=Erythrobacter sp. TaxID=1042 RepID=UPI002EB69452|nr:RsmB/NOP family class I SAM-dependent RNA methyltransferase [Erythrobacter sp.]